MAVWVYQFLASLGYTHPIHPALVHVPIGSIVAAFVFGVIGLLFRKQNVGRAAYYALVLAFVSLLPGIFFATTDWLRYFGGVWLFWIKMKVILSSVLFILLLVAIVTGLRDTGPTRLNVLMNNLSKRLALSRSNRFIMAVLFLPVDHAQASFPYTKDHCVVAPRTHLQNRPTYLQKLPRHRWFQYKYDRKRQR